VRKVFFHYVDKRPRIADVPKIKAFISEIFDKEATDFKRVDYIFCSDHYLLNLNKATLNHDYYTDILSFLMSDGSSPVVGEIYISIDRVKENAKKYQVSLKKELLRVIFHGILHFCNYNDKKEREKKLMRLKEEEFLEVYYRVNVSRETIIK
jgi:probable rRNA maturation factor